MTSQCTERILRACCTPVQVLQVKKARTFPLGAGGLEGEADSKQRMVSDCAKCCGDVDKP